MATVILRVPRNMRALVRDPAAAAAPFAAFAAAPPASAFAAFAPAAAAAQITNTSYARIAEVRYVL